MKAERRWKKEQLFTAPSKKGICPLESEKTTDLSNYKNFLPDSVTAFRAGTDIDTYREQDHSLAERVSIYTHSLIRSFSDAFRYMRHHLDNFRSIQKFYRSHDIHIIGKSVLSKYVELSLYSHERDGIDEYGIRISPRLQISFKAFPEPGNPPYIKGDFEKLVFELAHQCLKNGCFGLNIRATTENIALRNQFYGEVFPVALPGQSTDYLTFSIEWLDRQGDTIDAIFLRHPIASANSYEWIEQRLQDGVVAGETEKKIISLLSPNLLKTVLEVLKFGQNEDNFSAWATPCSRQKFQRFQHLYGTKCKLFQKHLDKPEVLDVEYQSDYVSIELSDHYYLIFDYFARLDHPAILLLSR